MTTQAEILAAARQRIAAALPGAQDRTDFAEGVASTRAPAFAVRMERQGAERFAMGNSTLRATERLTVTIWTTAGGADQSSLEARLAAFNALAEVAIMAEPRDFDDLAFDVMPSGSETATEAGEQRVGRADAAFDVIYLTAA